MIGCDLSILKGLTSIFWDVLPGVYDFGYCRLVQLCELSELIHFVALILMH